MKTISIHELKRNLSSLLAEVEGGRSFQVTRYRRPVAEISPVTAVGGLRVGSDFGRWRPRSVTKRATDGYYLKVLEEDRGDE